MATPPFADRLPVLTVPGLNNSGPGHWQTLWEAGDPRTHRVQLGHWSRPHRNSWVNHLGLAIRAAGRPVLLAAHSLGCHAVAWWAALEGAGAAQWVAGALLVAPPEVDEAPLDPRLSGFAPSPATPLPFPALLVTSCNDPYITLAGARRLAGQWGARLIEAGDLGHINAASGLGDWPRGKQWLEELRGGERGLDEPPSAGPPQPGTSFTLPPSPAAQPGRGSQRV